MQQFFDQVPKTTMILMDEAYHHFVDSPNYASATEWLDKLPNLVVARTFSKVYGLAGMRIGYGIGDKDVIAAMREQLLQDNNSSAGNCRGASGFARSGACCGVPVANQWVACTAYETVEGAGVQSYGFAG